MTARVRAFDWSRTPLGPLDAWPDGLQAAATTALRSPLPIAVLWGSHLVCLYNDAASGLLGGLHPRALGRPAREVLGDDWKWAGRQLRAALQRGTAILAQDTPVHLDSVGRREVAFLTLSLSPIIGEDKAPGGVLVVAQKTTTHVLRERRLRTLRQLAEAGGTADTAVDACRVSARLLQGNDIPLVRVYLAGGDGQARCVAAAPGDAAGRTRPLDVEAGTTVLESTCRHLVTGAAGGVFLGGEALTDRDGGDQARSRRLFLAGIGPSHERPRGYLLAGLRDELRLDAAYQEFLELAALGLSRNVEAARARQTARERAATTSARERQTAADELRTIVDRLRIAQRRITAVADAERRRIAQDLHDGAQQRLAAIRLELGLLRESLDGNGPAAARLDALRGEIDAALSEVRELAHGLYPPLLASDGLGAAVSAVARRAPLPVAVKLDGLSRAPRSIESAAYFCCLEALQNAGKHAGREARVWIRLSTRDGALEFRVCDDGAGFDMTSVRPGQGLVNLRDRVEALAGHIDVISAPGVGTEVRGWIPLP